MILFVRKCCECEIERNLQGEDTCKRPDKEDGDFLPAPLSHYCCVCAKRNKWTHFSDRACENCRARDRKSREMASGLSTGSGGGPAARGDESSRAMEDFVNVHWEFARDCEAFAKLDTMIQERAGALDSRAREEIRKECEVIRQAAIEQATKEAEIFTARILKQVQETSQSQMREAQAEVAELMAIARKEAHEIVEAAQRQASEELDNARKVAHQMMVESKAEAERIMEDAETKVAGAESWVEIGRGGDGWHRPSMAVFFRGELEAATGGFAKENCAGSGGFGSVYKADQLDGLGNGAPMAIKKLDSGSMQGHGEFLQELQVLGGCRHEHLLPVIGFASDSASASSGQKDQSDSSVCLVMPLMQGGNLEDRLFCNEGSDSRLSLLCHRKQLEPLKWQDRLRIITGLIRALLYLHTPDTSRCKPVILHRDIKPANILLDKRLNARLSDVGLAQLLSSRRKHVSNSFVCGTHGYLDPHYLQTGHFDVQCDAYAVGVTMLMTLTSTPVYYDGETIVDR
mmetsp:Transcript_44323/g.139854  ORF Transcript_44323/g.139854 Transcript_44323/m.139854 type:complete len:515 (-) Transcript_44323:767-2311(-)